MELVGRRIVVDDGIGPEEWSWVKQKLGLVKEDASEIIQIHQAHQGIPDGEIFRHLLTEGSALVTKDKALHNAIVKCKQPSWCLIGTTLRSKYIPGIPAANIGQDTARKDVPLQESYLQPGSVVRTAVLPTHPKELKRLRTRRRRIRNASGGLINIVRVDVTAACEQGQGAVGMQLDVVRIGQKKLAATDNCIIDDFVRSFPHLGVRAHVLTTVLRLHLQGVPLRVALNGEQFDEGGYEKECKKVPSSISEWMDLLSKEFTDVEYVYLNSSRSHYKLDRKMQGCLGPAKGEHAVRGSIEELVQRTEAFVRRKEEMPFD